jgi:type VI secretion system protein ImpB
MAKEQSVAPKERVNIVYKPATNAAEDVELPLKMLMLGDYSLQADARTLEDRKPINVDKDNFNDVLAAHQIELNLQVPNRLSKKNEEGDELKVKLKIQNIRDFEPDRVAEQVPELNQLLQVRQALIALRGPLGNVPSFRKKLHNIIKNEVALAKLYQELGIEGEVHE